MCSAADDLCPTVNYASARLALASDSVTQQTVSQASLGQVRPRAADRHSRAAPAARLQRAGPAALVGVHPERHQPGRWHADHHQPVRWPPDRRQPAGEQQRAAGAGAGAGLGVGDLGRPALAHPADALGAARPAAPIPVPLVWLNALPEGPAFAAPAIPGRGQPVAGPAAPGAGRAGLPGARRRGHAVLRAARRAAWPRSPRHRTKLLQFRAGRAGQTTLTGVAGHRSHSSATVPGGGLPASIPAAAAPARRAALCVVYASPAAAAADRAGRDRGPAAGGRRRHRQSRPMSARWRSRPGRGRWSGMPPAPAQTAARSATSWWRRAAGTPWRDGGGRHARLQPVAGGPAARGRGGPDPGRAPRSTRPRRPGGAVRRMTIGLRAWPGLFHNSPVTTESCEIRALRTTVRISLAT